MKLLFILIEIITHSFSQTGLRDDLNRKPCVKLFPKHWREGREMEKERLRKREGGEKGVGDKGRI